MARCNCAGNSCNCMILAGTGVVITGNGTAASPYQISVGGVDIAGRLTVNSSQSIVMSLTGQGSVADPYVVSAAVSPAQTAALDAAVLAAQAAANEVLRPVSESEDWSGTVVLPFPDQRGTYLKRRLTGNVDLTVAAGVAGTAHSCILELEQDGTGGRTLIIRDALTDGGVAFVLSAAPGATDMVRLEWNGTGWIAFLEAAALAVPAGWAV